jgi:hypothetical protein
MPSSANSLTPAALGSGEKLAALVFDRLLARRHAEV